MLDTLLRHLLLLIEPVGFLWACLLVLTVALVRRRLWRLTALSAFVVAAALHPVRPELPAEDAVE